MGLLGVFELHGRHCQMSDDKTFTHMIHSKDVI